MAASLASIKIDRETIGHVLRDGRKLFVPVNQRSYRWEEEHITDLYQDFARAISAGESEYFLGSIVVVKSASGRLEVNDGQQRLATSMILIAAIRNYFFNSGDVPTAEQIEKDQLLSTDRKTLESVPRFHLNNDDHQFFLKTIIERPAASVASPQKKKTDKPIKESHRRIAKAKEVASKQVENIVASVGKTGAAAELHKWLDFIEAGARVIWVEVSDERTAYIIFETMNDRGLKLSAADLLKNYIFGKADDRLQEAVGKWQSMTAIIETLGDTEDEIVDFIRYLWISKQGHIRSRDLYDSIKETIKNKTHALNWASELEIRSRDYAALINSSHEMWSQYGVEVRRQIETLTALGVKQIRPILLAAMTKFSKKEFSKLLHACICWSVRCLISGVPSGTLEGYYGKNALSITNGAITDVKSLAQQMANIIPDDVRFESAVAVASVAQTHLARYYLRALQIKEDNKPEPQYIPNDGKAVTLEHILPENPGPDWKHIASDVAKANWKRLGNQVLLAGTVNSKLGNVGYITKKAEFNKSDFSLTKKAANFNQWDASTIAQRQKELAKLSVLTWPL